ncbi:HD domain-containing protein [Sulfurimonas sp.]
MISYKFSSVSSVTNHQKNSNEKAHYELLSKYNLYDHTINCAICAIDIAEKKKLPSLTKETLILLALLHDFGKEPTIAGKYGDIEIEATKTKHNIYSKYFAKSFLRKHVGKNINEENFEIVVNTLENHHYFGVKQTLFLKLLREADTAARDAEEEFALNRIEIHSKSSRSKI